MCKEITTTKLLKIKTNVSKGRSVSVTDDLPVVGISDPSLEKYAFHITIWGRKTKIAGTCR